MLAIQIPPNNIKERRYAIDVIIGEYLGLDYLVEIKNIPFSASITLQNGNKLTFKDHFFSSYPENYSYLNENNIPSSITYIDKSKNPFISENNLPLIFGTDSIEIKENFINSGADIFASSFFMLTRWEEYVKKIRDQHERFPATASLALKHEFLKRPIVDEYTELLWNMLSFLEIKQKRKKRSFRAIITHDVDFPLQWRSPFSLVRKLGGDLLKRKSIHEAHRSFSSYINTIAKKENDPFDTFDYLMDSSEKHGLQSHFFFLCGGQHQHDKGHLPPSHPFMRDLMKKIDERGHIIGFHPSYDSYNNPQLFKQELELLQRYTPQDIKCGRQHFLRFDVQNTWRIWMENGLEWESSMYYAAEAGFRCGTCHSFPVFDCLERKVLKLIELPLTLMEGTFLHYQKSSPTKMLNDVIALLDQVKTYEGKFVMLWHNSAYHTTSWKPYSVHYEKILSTLTD